MDETYQSAIMQQKIHGGKITVYRLSGLDAEMSDRSYYYRFSHPFKRGYIRRSTKTNDYEMACAIAIRAYDQMKVKEHLGIRPEGVSIDVLRRDYFASMSQVEATVRLREWRFKKFLKPYFKNRDLYNVSDEDVWGYIRWRSDSFKPTTKAPLGVAISSIQGELGLLSGMFIRAFKKRQILAMPHIPNAGRIEQKRFENILFYEPAYRRATWNEEQQEQITKWQRSFRLRWKASMERDEGLDIGSRTCIDETNGARWGKVCFYMWIKLVKSSGVRSTELRKFTIGTVQSLLDEKTDQIYTVLKITKRMSKVNRRREVICNDLETIFYYWEDFKSEWALKFGRPPEANDWAFPKPLDPWGKEPQNISERFCAHIKRLDKETDVPVSFIIDPNDDVRRGISLYSIRKLYISKCLENPKLTPYIVARNCGTSLNMIEKVYNVNLNRKHRELFCAGVLHLRKLDEERGSPQD